MWRSSSEEPMLVLGKLAEVFKSFHVIYTANIYGFPVKQYNAILFISFFSPTFYHFHMNAMLLCMKYFSTWLQIFWGLCSTWSFTKLLTEERWMLESLSYRIELVIILVFRCSSKHNNFVVWYLSNIVCPQQALELAILPSLRQYSVPTNFEPLFSTVFNFPQWNPEPHN